MTLSESQVRHTDENTCISMLSEAHRPMLQTFHSKNAELNEFLRNDAWGFQDLHFGTTYLLLSNTQDRVLAYITLSMGAIRMTVGREDFQVDGRRLGKFPKDFPNQFPAVLIGRLATDKGEEGRGAATLLLSFAVQVALDERKKIGCVCLTAHAYRDDEVLGWYLNKRFKPCPDARKEMDTVPLYYELK